MGREPLHRRGQRQRSLRVRRQEQLWPSASASRHESMQPGGKNGRHGDLLPTGYVEVVNLIERWTGASNTMRRLIHATDAEFADLAQRSVGRCIRLLAAELPPGVAPRRGKVGIERYRSGPMIIYVQKRCVTHGLPRQVQAWFDAGELVFQTPAAMRWWLWRDLGPCYQRARANRVENRARIWAAVVRVGAEFGFDCTDVDGDVIAHLDLCVDVASLDDMALRWAVRGLLEPQLSRMMRSRACARVVIRLLSGLLIAWAVA